MSADYDKLSDRELDALVAERVMEWPAKLVAEAREGFAIVIPGTGQLRGPWMPSYYPDDAYRVVERMRERGWWMKMTSPFDENDNYHAGFCPAGTTGFNGRMDYSANGATPWRPICIAALRALETP